MSDLRLKKLADLLVNYSTEVKKGDFVFVSCENVSEPWMKEVVKAAVIAGGHVETILQSSEVNNIKLKYSTKEQLLEEHSIPKYVYQKADVWLSAWGTSNTKVNSNIDPLKIQIASKGGSSAHKIYSQRMGDKSLRWCGTQYPTYADAQEARMSLSEYEDFVYGAGLMDLDNPIEEWKKVSAQQERWVRYLDNKKEIHIVSEGTDIKVNVMGRKWINCDGKENFPDGEIFTCPVEDGVNGHISFSFPGIYMGQEIEGIKIEVEKGKIISASADKGEKLLKTLIALDDGSSRFGEVAIGTNYGIKNFTRNMLFDEKIGGTVHMAVGDSMPEAGGLNRSDIHWDMLCDMRKYGSIYADDELFYENGQFKNEILTKYNL